MQIAIFGGSFDPVHKGHEQIVKKALKKLTIDKFLLIPTYLNPIKHSSHLSAKKRFTLLKKLFFKQKNVHVSSYEIDQKKPVFSIETIKHMKKKYNASKIYLIIGADNYNTFHLWKDYKKIKKLVNLVVVTRDGFKQIELKKVKVLKVDVKVSSSYIRSTYDTTEIPKIIKKDLKKIFKKKDKELE